MQETRIVLLFVISSATTQSHSSKEKHSFPTYFLKFYFNPSFPHIDLTWAGRLGIKWPLKQMGTGN